MDSQPNIERSGALNSNQERIVGATLLLLEERVADIEEILERPRHGALHRRPAPTLSSERRLTVDSLIAQLRATVAIASADLGLQPVEQDPLRRIRGLLSLSWESLGEIAGSRMQGYGPSTIARHRALEPVVGELTGLVRALRHAFEDLPDCDASPGELAP